MNVPGALLWGFVATIALTMIATASVAVGLSRMSIPFLLGTTVTADRSRAPLYGSLLHVAIGWGFAFLYAAIFESVDRAGAGVGAALGLFHGAGVLILGLPVLPAFHPRMASEHQGPEPTRALEPPGFLGLHYGRATPAVTLVSHLAYGVILGLFYELA